jgi:hypothetical protein
MGLGTATPTATALFYLFYLFYLPALRNAALGVPSHDVGDGVRGRAGEDLRVGCGLSKAHSHPEVLVAHANARTTVHGRLLMVARHRAGWPKVHIVAAMEPRWTR